MNEEYIKLFIRMSGGRLFHSIEKAKQQDPSERVNLNPSKTREIFEQAGLSSADHALWRDTKMLGGMAAIAYEQWSKLNSNNLKIQADFEDCIADNRDQFNWQDISLGWVEAEILAAEEHIKQLATGRHNINQPKAKPEDNRTQAMSYTEMKRHLQERTNGVSDGAIQRQTSRALQTALDEEKKLPIQMSGCVYEYAINEIHKPAEPGEKTTVKQCRYIFTKEGQEDRKNS